MARLTSSQIIAKFSDHPNIRVTRHYGGYEIWKYSSDAPSECMAFLYNLAELREWAARF